MNDETRSRLRTRLVAAYRRVMETQGACAARTGADEVPLKDIDGGSLEPGASRVLSSSVETTRSHRLRGKQATAARPRARSSDGKAPRPAGSQRG